MIVAPHPGGHFVVRQRDHGLMAAALVDAWGNERFGGLASRQEIREAELLHDSGWDIVDDEPMLDAGTGLPTGFRGVPRQLSLAVHREAVHDCREEQPYVALLISRHFSGMHARPSLLEIWQGDARLLRRFLVESAVVQRELRPRVSADDAEIDRSAALTRIIDGISIAMLEGRPVHVRRDVPAADGKAWDVAVTRVTDTRFQFDPWPFAAGSMHVEVSGRLLTHGYSETAQMRAGLAHTPVVSHTYELVPL